jgi:hypothetical protein
VKFSDHASMGETTHVNSPSRRGTPGLLLTGLSSHAG